MVSKAACIHCGACERVCVHPDHCIACGDCISVCRGGFRKIVGQTWLTPQLVNRLMKDADVYRMSGGGVTFSGGEPLMQWGFVSDVIQKLEGVHVVIETSGYASDEIFADAMDKCDLIMMDWKVSDPALHLHYTGVEQDRILRHAQMLAAGDTPFILRMPVIPGVNDDEAHFRTAAGLVKGSKSLVRIDVLPYQRAAGAKYEMVSMEYRPDFEEDRSPRFFTEIFDQEGVPYQIFR